jgi:glycogen synthase
MTHVLMTADTVGGVWTYALELADALAPHGVQVTLATMGRPLTEAQRDELGASAVVDVHESGFALEWMDEPWADVDRAAGWLLGLEDELAPDVVHLNGYAHASLPWRVPSVVVGHSCVLSWWEAVHGEAPPPSWDEYRRRVVAGLRNAGALVAPTAALLDALQRCYGTTGGIVVPNCRRDPQVTLAEKQPFVLAAGRLWDEAKNVAALDRVAPRLGVPVLIAGSAEHPSGGEDWEPAGARLLGPIASSELWGWMARAQVFALPARYEPFGLAALEAGLAGCALVLGDIPSLREVWGDAALFVDPDDDEALCGAVESLLRDDRRRRLLADRAIERARAHTPEQTARGYLDVYSRLRAPVRNAS